MEDDIMGFTADKARKLMTSMTGSERLLRDILEMIRERANQGYWYLPLNNFKIDLVSEEGRDNWKKAKKSLRQMGLTVNEHEDGAMHSIGIVW